jgi:hypothetical protein
MNITTHGKDGTRIRFMENEKRRWIGALGDLERVARETDYHTSSEAQEAAKSLKRFLFREGMLDDQTPEQKDPPYRG